MTRPFYELAIPQYLASEALLADKAGLLLRRKQMELERRAMEKAEKEKKRRMGKTKRVKKALKGVGKRSSVGESNYQELDVHSVNSRSTSHRRRGSSSGSYGPSSSPSSSKPKESTNSEISSKPVEPVEEESVFSQGRQESDYSRFLNGFLEEAHSTSLGKSTNSDVRSRGGSNKGAAPEEPPSVRVEVASGDESDSNSANGSSTPTASATQKINNMFKWKKSTNKKRGGAQATQQKPTIPIYGLSLPLNARDADTIADYVKDSKNSRQNAPPPSTLPHLYLKQSSMKLMLAPDGSQNPSQPVYHTSRLVNLTEKNIDDLTETVLAKEIVRICDRNPITEQDGKNSNPALRRMAVYLSLLKLSYGQDKAAAAAAIAAALPQKTSRKTVRNIVAEMNKVYIPLESLEKLAIVQALHPYYKPLHFKVNLVAERHMMRVSNFAAICNSLEFMPSSLWQITSSNTASSVSVFPRVEPSVGKMTSTASIPHDHSGEIPNKRQLSFSSLDIEDTGLVRQNSSNATIPSNPSRPVTNTDVTDMVNAYKNFSPSALDAMNEFYMYRQGRDSTSPETASVPNFSSSRNTRKAAAPIYHHARTDTAVAPTTTPALQCTPLFPNTSNALTTTTGSGQTFHSDVRVAFIIGADRATFLRANTVHATNTFQHGPTNFVCIFTADEEMNATRRHLTRVDQQERLEREVERSMEGQRMERRTSTTFQLSSNHSGRVENSRDGTNSTHSLDTTGSVPFAMVQPVRMTLATGGSGKRESAVDAMEYTLPSLSNTVPISNEERQNGFDGTKIRPSRLGLDETDDRSLDTSSEEFHSVRSMATLSMTHGSFSIGNDPPSDKRSNQYTEETGAPPGMRDTDENTLDVAPHPGSRSSTGSFISMSAADDPPSQDRKQNKTEVPVRKVSGGGPSATDMESVFCGEEDKPDTSGTNLWSVRSDDLRADYYVAAMAVNLPKEVYLLKDIPRSRLVGGEVEIVEVDKTEQLSRSNSFSSTSKSSKRLNTSNASNTIATSNTHNNFGAAPSAHNSALAEHDAFRRNTQRVTRLEKGVEVFDIVLETLRSRLDPFCSDTEKELMDKCGSQSLYSDSGSLSERDLFSTKESGKNGKRRKGARKEEVKMEKTLRNKYLAAYREQCAEHRRKRKKLRKIATKYIHRADLPVGLSIFFYLPAPPPPDHFLTPEELATHPLSYDDLEVTTRQLPDYDRRLCVTMIYGSTGLMMIDAIGKQRKRILQERDCENSITTASMTMRLLEDSFNSATTAPPRQSSSLQRGGTAFFDMENTAPEVAPLPPQPSVAPSSSVYLDNQLKLDSDGTFQGNLTHTAPPGKGKKEKPAAEMLDPELLAKSNRPLPGLCLIEDRASPEPEEEGVVSLVNNTNSPAFLHEDTPFKRCMDYLISNGEESKEGLEVPVKLLYIRVGDDLYELIEVVDKTFSQYREERLNNPQGEQGVTSSDMRRHADNVDALLTGRETLEDDEDEDEEEDDLLSSNASIVSILETSLIREVEKAQREQERQERLGQQQLHRRHRDRKRRAAVSTMGFGNQLYSLSTAPGARRQLVSMCWRCLTSEALVLFLPCGHFAVCVACADELYSCCVCESTIEATITLR